MKYLPVLLALVFCGVVRADEAVRADLPVEGVPPVFGWDFSAVDFRSSTGGLSVSGLHGAPTTSVAGPRPPEFPGFAEGNTALLLDGVSRLEISDAGSSVLDFADGDAIAIAAWVRTADLKEGQQVYLIGKGRTGRAGMLPENQNWALRLRGMGGTARVSFLFRSADTVAVVDSSGQESVKVTIGELHRWNSDVGFAVDGEWHHVVVSFRFGSKVAPVAWIDGEPVEGTWDLGGKTFHRPPHVDDDQVWIGSALGGNSGNSFRGAIDDLSVYRSELKDADIRGLYRTTRRTQSIPETADQDLPSGAVLVDIRENVRQSKPWDRERTRITMQWQQPAAALTRLPRKYVNGGVIGDRSSPSVLRMRTQLSTAEVTTQFLIRARSASRLLIDGTEVATLTPLPYASDGHQEVPEPPAPLYPEMHPVPAGDQEVVVEVPLSAGRHLVEFESLVGGRSMRVEASETLVAMGSAATGFEVISPTDTAYRLDEGSWRSLVARQEEFLVALEARDRREKSAEETAWWEQRHAEVRALVGMDAAEISPEEIDRRIEAGLQSRGFTASPLVDDLVFLRRLSLNTVGVIPSVSERDWFLALPAETRREQAIERYLADRRWADHWVSYWQDVLAENPGILKPELNNSGPFRWWIYESVLDNMAMDRFATELILMRGSRLGGGPSGFAMASQNDVPMAERAIVLMSAFSAQNLKCARCHDSPVNDVSQQQLFAMAALLQRAPLTIPATSSVPKGPNGERSSLITVSLEPGATVAPAWSFGGETEGRARGEIWQRLLRHPDDPREQLALHLTHPTESEFAKVVVNRLWTRLFGQGLVQNPDDWYGVGTEHAELLDILSRQHMASGYDLKATARLILKTRAWQRESAPADAPIAKSFGAMTIRRMTAEQLVDSLYVAAGKSFDSEMLTLDPEGRRPDESFLNLGTPTRAWQLCSLSNERDRPALALPVAQSLVDLLTVFGWRDSRPHSLTERETEATVLQTLTLANGNAGHRLVQLSDNTVVTENAIEAASPESLVEHFFQRILTRSPNDDETRLFAEELRPGFDGRLVPGAVKQPLSVRRNAVSWSNHLNSEATRLKQEQEEAARLGDPPSGRLTEEWRVAAEDVIWVLLNSPEFAFVP